MSEQALPERPDAGQLRRMAKELRAAARAGDLGAVQRLRNHVDADPATVSLSVAQLVVAREHGFASWPRLMEHLEARRRPVLSSLSPRPAVAASALDDGQTVVLAGRVTSIVSDAQDSGRLWLTVVPVIGAAPGESRVIRLRRTSLSKACVNSMFGRDSTRLRFSSTNGSGSRQNCGRNTSWLMRRDVQLRSHSRRLRGSLQSFRKRRRHGQFRSFSGNDGRHRRRQFE